MISYTSKTLCGVSSAVWKIELKIIDTKIYVPFVTLSIEDNIKLLKKLESDFS